MGISQTENYVTGPGAGGPVTQSNNGNAYFGQTNMGQGFDPTVAYDPQLNTAENQANNYNGMANAAGQQSAPAISNPYAQQTAQQVQQAQAQQAALGASLQKTAANGQNSAAYQQYVAGQKQGQQAQTAIAASAAPGAAGAGARRSAQQQNAVGQAGSVAGGQLVAQQAQQQAQGQLATNLGQQGALAGQNYAFNQQNALSAAQLQQQEQAQNNAALLGYNQLSQGEQQQALSSLNGAAGALQQSQGINQGESSANFNQVQTAVAGGMGAVSGIAGVGSSMGSSTPTPDMDNGSMQNGTYVPNNSTYGGEM